MPDNKNKFPAIVKLLNDKYNDLIADGGLSKTDKLELKAIADSSPEITKFKTHSLFDHMIFIHKDASGKERRYVNEDDGITIFKPLTPVYGWISEEFIKRESKLTHPSELKNEVLNLLSELHKNDVVQGSSIKNFNNVLNISTQKGIVKD